jgi:hypothetical protein
LACALPLAQRFFVAFTIAALRAADRTRFLAPTNRLADKGKCKVIFSYMLVTLLPNFARGARRWLFHLGGIGLKMPRQERGLMNDSQLDVRKINQKENFIR